MTVAVAPLTLSLILALGAGSPTAQIYPVPQRAGSIGQLLAPRHDFRLVTVRGSIVGVVEPGELYMLADGTGTVLIKTDRKHWPHAVSIDPQTTVEVTGELDFESSGASKLKVYDLHAVPQQSPD